MEILAVGGPQPLGGGGSGGWDWWVLAGALALLLLIETARRRPPAVPAVALAAVGGLVVADLTHLWGVTPVWGTIALVALWRNLRRGVRRRQV